jgi:hypothetical protein
MGWESLLEGDVEDADSITLILLKAEKRKQSCLNSTIQA